MVVKKYQINYSLIFLLFFKALPRLTLSIEVLREKKKFASSPNVFSFLEFAKVFPSSSNCISKEGIIKAKDMHTTCQKRKKNKSKKQKELTSQQ